MKWILETTKDAKYPLHIYYVSDDRSKMVGYIASGTTELKRFSKPLSLIVKGRKFQELKSYAEDDGVYFEKTLDKLNTNNVVGQVKNYIIRKMGTKLTCTCPGFQFRRLCKHVTEFR